MYVHRINPCGMERPGKEGTGFPQVHGEARRCMRWARRSRDGAGTKVGLAIQYREQLEE